ncbi:TPA: response regulator [bacterium]|nr:response regulator [bacterium]
MRDIVFHIGPIEQDMENRVHMVENELNRIEKREDEKTQVLTLPIDLWLESGYEDSEILVIHGEKRLSPNIINILKDRGYRVQEATNEQEAMSAFRRASYKIMIVPWVMFERSGDFVKLLRKAFPQTKIIITSPNFAWSSEDIVGAKRGQDSLDAGAYSYVPDRNIEESILTCIESAMKSKEKSCPVLTAGLKCNLICKL